MTKRWIVIGVTAALVLGACGGDDKSSSTGDKSGDSNSTFCKKARAVDQASTGLIGITDPKQAEAKYKDLISAAKDAVKSAPSSIKSKMQTQLDALEKFFDIAKKDGFDFNKIDADPAYQAIADSVGDDPEVEAYLHDVCGIDTGSSSSNTTVAGQTSQDPQIAAIQAAFPSISADQAQCLLDLGTNVANSSDPSKILDAFKQCGIDASALGGG